MNKLTLTLILLFCFLSTFGQNYRDTYSIDIEVNNPTFYQKLIKYDSILYTYSVENPRKVYDPINFPHVYQDKNELERLVNKLKTKRTNKVRIFYTLSMDLKEIYIDAIAPIFSFNTEELYSNNKALTFYYINTTNSPNIYQPKFVVPLCYYYSIIPEKEIIEIIEFSENAIINNINNQHYISQNDTIKYIDNDVFTSLFSFDEKYFSSSLLYKTPIYYKPIDSNEYLHSINQMEHLKYLIDCPEVYEINDTIWAENHVKSIYFSGRTLINKGEYSMGMFNAVSKITLQFDFIGVEFLKCDSNLNNQILWIKWNDFFKHHYNDEVLETSLNNSLNKYLYKRLVKKE